MYFRYYGLRKKWLDNCLKSPVSEDPSTRNMVNAPKHCLNLKERSFTKFNDHFESIWVGKKPLLLICKFLRLLVNTMTADGKYSLLNRDNLTQAIQMQLSRKQKTFSKFFCPFFKSNLNFWTFSKKRWLS